jgi:polyphosphate kinase 2 (PPK2 family)
LYDEYTGAAEEMLELTDSENAPWVIVEATSKSYARRKIFETVIRALEQRLGPAAVASPKEKRATGRAARA